jgi:hypothetical protein
MDAYGRMGAEPRLKGDVEGYDEDNPYGSEFDSGVSLGDKIRQLRPEWGRGLIVAPGKPERC